MDQVPVIFIVGPPRSGTTILGEVLDHHPSLAHWYEPYFVWDRHFRGAPDDCRSADDATPRVRDYIRRAFAGFQRSTGARWVVDKSPRNCLRLPFLQAVFPEAKFLFILRDGRETILSFNLKWERRRAILQGRGARDRWSKAWQDLKMTLAKQPLLRHRLSFLLFELGPPSNWLRGRIHSQARWDGQPGWGPQFPGWREARQTSSTLQFNAQQWLHCVQGIEQALHAIDPQRRMTINYEQFTQDPGPDLEQIFAFLGVEFPADFLRTMPQVRSGNIDKWRRAFSPEQLKEIGPVIGQALIQLGYEPDEAWYHDLG